MREDRGGEEREGSAIKGLEEPRKHELHSRWTKARVRVARVFQQEDTGFDFSPNEASASRA